MNEPFWLKQTKNKPLFENLLWSRPENKTRAGKLLIIGGSSHGFSAPAMAFNSATSAGAGSLKVLLPESLRSSVGWHLEDAVYAPSNKGGSMSREALAEFLDYAAWADLTLLAGDFGHNSETSILIESFIHDYKGPLCLTDDSIDPFLINPSDLFTRPETVIVADISKLQKLVIKTKMTKAITTSMNLIQIVELLRDLTLDYKIGIVTYHQGQFIAAVGGKVSTTEAGEILQGWHLSLASYTSVWWLQNKPQPFESITTATYDFTNR